MYDIVVIGCGPGGYAAAIRASQLGGSVAIVEAGYIGGTCVNTGCIPSKIWLKAAHLLKSIKNGEEFGIKAVVDKIDFKAIIERKNGVAGDIRMGMEALLSANNIDLLRGHGIVKSANEVSVDGKIIKTKNIILSTGSSPDIPDISNLKEALLSIEQIFDMTVIPESVLIWGEAGPIGVEMATLLNALGTKVYLATQHPRILSQEDHDTSQRLAQAFREQKIEMLTRLTLDSIKKSKTGFEVTLIGNKEKSIVVEKVIITTRKPNSSGFGLEQTAVNLNDYGGVTINEKLETSVKGIYAIGDITGGWMNSHAASAMAITAAENAMGENNKFLNNLVPRVVWTYPQVGSVGLSEEAAEKQGFEVEIGDFPYAINGLAMCYGETDGAVKIVMEAESKEILGIHIVGSNATELVGEAVLALQLECTVDELAHTIRAHPTFSEALMDAGRDASQWALYLPPKQG